MAPITEKLSLMSYDRPLREQIVVLKDRVVRGFNESHWREVGLLTDTYDIVARHPRLLRSLSFGDPDYEGSVIDVIKDIIEADPGNLAIFVEFVDQKCPETGGEFISSNDDGARRIVFSPSVFRVPVEKPEINLVSVMMPFEASLAPVYDTIRAACGSVGLACNRADDIWDDSTIIQDVFSLIFRSYIVVCDFTGKNPNVFYEAGIAHTLGKHVIPVTQNGEHIPFDLRHHRYATYLNNAEGRAVLQQELEGRLRGLATKKGQANWM